jgi:NitT/TauT family transport system substrate-binding protein
MTPVDGNHAPRASSGGRWLCLVLIGCAAIAVGCGGDDHGGATETSLRVGVIPIVDVAPLYLGREQGFFEEENLAIEPVPAQGGAAIVPSVVSGDFQIGFANVVSLLIARDRGIPVTIVAEGTKGGKDERSDSSALLVRGDGKIQTAEDLEGTTIALNTLKNVTEVTAKAALEEQGVDVDKLDFVEVPFPDMIPALESGRVDAVFVVEPFVTLGKQGGARQITAPFAATAPNLSTATYFTTERYLAGHEDVVRRFTRALEKSLRYAEDHPDEAREILLTYTEIPEPAAENLTLPNWDPEINRAGVARLGELSQKHGLLENAPTPTDELIHAGR